MIRLNENDTVLFQGDSITDGAHGRNNDPNHILGHGFACSICSRLGADNIEREPKFYNRGQSGDGIAQMYARWEQDALALRPTLINILIGVNDSCQFRPITSENRGMPSDRFEAIYRSILEDTYAALPDVRFILCEPFYLPLPTTDETRLKKYPIVREEVAGYQAVTRKLAREYGCIFVPLQDLFETAAQRTSPDYLIWDSVHPTMVGHEFITRRWFEVVEPLLGR